MIDRSLLFEVLTQRLTESRALALLGARQVGKTTLAQLYATHHNCVYFDLEDPQSLEHLSQPMVTLDAALSAGRTIVIDEVQRRAELFPVLRTLIDRHARNSQFLLLGSASPLLLQQSGESLAGRLGLLYMSGVALSEWANTDNNSGAKGLSPVRMNQLWLRGGFPRALLAPSARAAMRWLRDYLSLVIERDMPQMGLNVPAPTMQRFWRLLAHYHGQTWNAAEPARSLGVSEPTVRKYLDFLVGLQLVRQLPPWHENLAKRQVKAPKIYVRDSGLLHYLWGVEEDDALWLHPKSGASWEGFALEQVLHVAQPDEAYFWATHSGAELDLLMFKRGLRVGVEFKRVDAPKITPSMLIAIQDLHLDALYVVYPGQRRYHLHPTSAAINAPIEAIPLNDLATLPADWN
ncbi:ATP-binding protein [Rhodoferax sp.]|uniref:ATP-binding protein n=1 Tax=Rhodoferax sp. TaxID=50421 RepID=UPI0025E2A7BF|nr:ATP-binding protein [Rhodoferax sp.]MCM2340516.1 ATP-binding protein [Rhodoferax sp.]